MAAEETVSEKIDAGSREVQQPGQAGHGAFKNEHGRDRQGAHRDRDNP